MRVRLLDRVEDGRSWPVLCWQAGPGWRMVSSGVVGGGLGERRWWLNAMVPLVYHHPDPAAHVAEIAAGFGLDGEGCVGVGMLTAADVRQWCSAGTDGVEVAATVGLGWPVWAAVPTAGLTAETDPRPPVGTINLLVVVPEPVTDAALVNLVLTATEAKTQALVESGVPGSGTASDSVCVACPALDVVRPGTVLARADAEYGGPRSYWGSRVALAVHTAVSEGTRRWIGAHQPGWAAVATR